MKGRVCEVSLGRREGSSYGESGRGMRSCCPTTSQILGPTGTGFSYRGSCSYRYKMHANNPCDSSISNFLGPRGSFVTTDNCGALEAFLSYSVHIQLHLNKDCWRRQVLIWKMIPERRQTGQFHTAPWLIRIPQASWWPWVKLWGYCSSKSKWGCHKSIELPPLPVGWNINIRFNYFL